MPNDQTVTIYVMGSPHEWPKNDDITYAQVVTFEVPGYSVGSGITYSVKYTKGHGDKPEGVLPPGGTVKVKDGMRFTVTDSGQS